MSTKSFIAGAILSLISVLVPAQAQAQTDHATFGVQMGYATKNESMATGLFLQYRISEMLRISPEVGCIFRHNDLDAFTLDLNVHAPINFGSERFSLYPLAGFNYTSWGVHNLLDKNLEQYCTRKGRVGINLGAGFEYLATSTLKVKCEWKYTITSKYSNCVISAGLGYMF